MTTKVIVGFRSHKVEIDLDDDSSMSVGQLRSHVVASAACDASSLEPYDIKLIYKGKVLTDDSQQLSDLFFNDDNKAPRASYRLIATGVSKTETNQADQEYRESQKKNNILVWDDLSAQGQQKERARKNLGRQMMSKARAAAGGSNDNNYGFGRIEILPNLPDQDKAREILTTLANDVGVRACMAKHKWNVGSLAELYPDGKVGQSKVCVMGLNRNQGQQILLRIRTDDLKGFRKMTSIREVLYHELAHNVHSDHDSNFFQLMRQIKKECLEMDWTGGAGTTSSDPMDVDNDSMVIGGTYTLGGNLEEPTRASARELAARAAMLRLSAEEEEVQQHCGCGYEHVSFLPPSMHNSDQVDES